MPDITVINGGIPGYSTAQTIRLLDERVWALEPTLLVLASFWSDTKYESFRDKDLLASLDLGQSQFLASSALVRWMAPWVSQFRSEDSARIVTWVHGDALPAASQRRVGVVDYAKNLDHIVRAAAKRGIGVVLLTPPSPVEIEAKVNPPHQWDAYRAVQKAVAKHHGLAHIEMTPVFKAVYDNDSPPILSKLFLDDLHPSVKGQIIMAQMLQRVLAQRGWPQDQILGKPDSPFDTSGLTASHHAGRASQPADPSSPVSNLFVSPKVKQDRARQPAAQAGVRVQIKGGAGPYRLTVQSQGRTVASATVQSPRVVQLRLRGVAGEVHLEVTDGVGEIRQQRLTVGSQRPTNASFDFGALK
jgi:lysophospholipase L1-like esterase